MPCGSLVEKWNPKRVFLIDDDTIVLYNSRNVFTLGAMKVMSGKRRTG